jgi:hypothetical protein
MPTRLPGHRSRRAQFDELVTTVVRHLEVAWGSELAGTEFAVEEVPITAPRATEVPLGRLYPAEDGQATRIIVYRRPIMLRAIDEDDLKDLVFMVVVEQVAHLLDIDPEEVDPTYTDGYSF